MKQLAFDALRYKYEAQKKNAVFIYKNYTTNPVAVGGHLVNNVLRDFNEVELTSSNFGASRGVQSVVKDYINRSITDILNSELNWPFTRAEGSIDVIAGKQLYSYESISSTLKYVDYDNMFLRPKNYITNGDFEIAGVASITNWTKSTTLTVSSGNEVLLSETTFTATATTHYVSFTEAAGNAAFVKLVELSENVDSIPLKYLSYEEYNERFRDRDTRPDTSKYADPEYVYTSYNNEIGLTPIPDTSNRTLEFDFYVSHTDLSGSTDTGIIPTRFEPVINARAKYYTHIFRSDVQSAQFSLKEYEDGIKRMRIELLNRKNYMRAV